MSSLPLQVEALTAAWLSVALGSWHPGVVVETAEVRDVIRGTSTKVRMVLRCNAAGRAAGVPDTVIVKGGFEPHSVHFGFMYETEMRFYRDLLPRLPMNAPRCWFAASDPGSHQSLVILDDLVPRGVRFCSAQRPHSLAEAQAFVEAMARWHAVWWARPELRDGGDLGWVQTQFDEPSWSYYNRCLEPEVWTHWMSQPRGQAVSAVLRDGERMRRALMALEADRRSMPFTLCHGDTHPGNLYLESDGRPGFLDAQMKRSPWVQDVAYHVTASVDSADRPHWERELLMHYLRCLASEGVAGVPSFDEAWRTYRRELVYGLFIFLINDTRFQTEATNTAVAARFGAAVLEHRSFNLLLD